MPAEAPVQNAGGLLIDPAGRILLGLRAAHKSVAPNLWDIVGGRVESGESLEKALVREVTEELGVQPVRFLLLDTVPEPPHGLPDVLHHVFAITEWSGGDPYNACDEHAEIRWFTIDEVRELANKTPLDFADLQARGQASLPVRP